MPSPMPPDSKTLIQSDKKIEALEQQARELARSVETVRQQALAQSNERIAALERKARDLALFVETTRQQTLLQADTKTEALEQKARDLADFVETLQNQTRVKSETEIEALVQKARDLAHFVETVRKETRLQSEAEIAALAKKARDLAVSVESVREKTLLQSDIEIATLGRQAREQLRQAQKMESIGLLAGGIAHDFNNLLTVINGRSELMIMRNNPDEKIRAQLELILSTGERAAALTHQLLAFSRQQVLQPKVLNLNNIAGDMDVMLQRLIPEDISLQTMLDPTVRPVMADPSQIEQVILNLVLNARDAMPNGGKLTIESANVELSEAYCRTRNEVKPGHYVMLAFSDTGTGMDAAVMPRIFEPFFTTKGIGKGTGLGLSTVYGIVKQSNGHIEVYSELGKGTVFKIYLPYAPDSSVSTQSQEMLKSVSTGSETILLVEDEDGVRDLARDFLEMSGYTVLAACDGEAALKLFTEGKIDVQLLITDVVMPKMGGPELVDRLRKLRPDLKVLYTSGYPDHAIVHSGTLAADVNFIQKPFTPKKLSRKIREIIDAA